jgi:hypothetical protein
MLSSISWYLTYSLAALYALLGAILFLMPGAGASMFAWKVSPFVAMTIGGWCLGNAWLAWVCTRRWDWSLSHATLLYLWLFGLLQVIVVVVFRDKLLLDYGLAWLYLGALVVNCLAAVMGVAEWAMHRPPLLPLGAPVTMTARVFTVAYVAFVLFLGLYGSFTIDGGRSGRVFPEVISPFTLRSFGALYLALSLSAMPLVFAKGLAPLLHTGYASFGLIVFITTAALVNLSLFDFSNRPLGMLYIGAYVAVGLVVGAYLIGHGTGGEDATERDRP